MNLLKAFAIIFLFMVVNIYSQTEDWSKLRTQIEEKNKQFDQAMIKGDQKTMSDMFAENSYSMPSYMPMEKGKTGVEKMAKQDEEMGTKYKDFKTTVKEFYGDGKYAYEIGTYSIEMSNKEMKNMKDNGKYLNVWEKQSDGSWKIKAQIWNTDMNPWADMKMDKTKMDHMKTKDMDKKK